jgi:LAO/AO transport system kinase
MSKWQIEYNVEELFQGIRAGNRALLSKAITMVESARADHQRLASELIQKCLPYTGNAKRIGISGSPGVGKSTFIEYFGNYLVETHLQTQPNDTSILAVLAIDPSSQLTRGSILGDKTRMELLGRNPTVYIRPSASGKTLGGVARKTREATVLLEAAGFKYIVVETVGVGQSEISVRQMVDCFLLLLLPGAGDDLQGIKKGIVEIADVLLVNKAEGDNLPLAHRTVGFYASALHLMRGREDQWQIPVIPISALEGTGLPKVLETIDQFFNILSIHIQQSRQSQSVYWMETALEHALMELFLDTPGMKSQYQNLKRQVHAGQINAFKAVDDLVQLFKNQG